MQSPFAFPLAMTLFQPRISIVKLPPRIETLIVHADYDDAYAQFCFTGADGIKRLVCAIFRYGRTDMFMRTRVRRPFTPVLMATHTLLSDDVLSSTYHRPKLMILSQYRLGRTVTVQIHHPTAPGYNPRVHRPIFVPFAMDEEDTYYV
jgi:hypothetical protein